jgi:glycosyltransferase involved in cell wall biosynthesis
MYKDKTVCVVTPAFNEERQIGKVIETMPSFIDRIVVVDDASQDDTQSVVEEIQRGNDKVVLLHHSRNKGHGGALASGYKWAIANDFDIAVRMDGDGQMNPDDLSGLLEPIVTGKANFAKGNRLFTGEAYKRIPKVRYFGNAFLSLLTKIASGYWRIADFQSGYTAIDKRALHTIDWDLMYKDYGQPNDLLVRLNVYNFRVVDVPVEPIYRVGEKSGMKISRVVFTLSWLLVKLFFWRMKEKYIIRDFHPLVFFYAFGGFFSIASVLLFARVFYKWATIGHIPSINALAAFFSFMSASMFTLFAMWFDMEANKNLKQ